MHRSVPPLAPGRIFRRVSGPTVMLVNSDADGRERLDDEEWTARFLAVDRRLLTRPRRNQLGSLRPPAS